jgi:hypothetical protein
VPAATLIGFEEEQKSEIVVSIHISVLTTLQQGDDTRDEDHYSDDDLEEDGDDTRDEDHYSDHVSGGPKGSREINMPTDGSGTRATN